MFPLGYTMLNELSVTKDKYCMIPFARGIWNSQIHRSRKQSIIYRVVVGSCFMGTGSYKMKSF
jgi:hypothetical protein